MNKFERVPKIYYYSDCPFFAGCENMIANFLSDHDFCKKYNLKLVYRYTYAYQKGLSKRLNNNIDNTVPVWLLNQINYNSSYVLLSFLFKLIYIPYKYFTIIVNTLILYKLFAKEKIDILHINNGGYPAAISCYSAVFAAKLSGIKCIVYVVNNIAQPYNNFSRYIDKPIDRLVVRFVNKFITSSKAAGKILVDVLNIPNDKYITINNGISKREVTINKDYFKFVNNIPKDKIIFSTIANFEIRKGHKNLIDAIILLSRIDHIDIFDKVHFLLEGNGPEKLFISEYIKRYDLDCKVQILDDIEDIYNLYNITDVLIVPSIANEDFPNVVLEAMSLGKSVIGTDIAGIPEQIENMITGIVIEPNSANDIKNAILSIYNDIHLLSTFSKNTLIKFSNHYTKKIALENYDKLYRNLLTNK